MPSSVSPLIRGTADPPGASPLSVPRAIVIGAGIGGLAAALDLACRGLAVTVVEQAAQPGGKMREIDVQGKRIDSGPTVFTMPWVFESLFADAGSQLSEHVTIRRDELIARHAWPGGAKLDLFDDRERTTAAIEDFAGRSEAAGFNAFCDRAGRVFETLDKPFMRNPRPTLPSLIAASGLRGLVDLWRLKPFQSLWSELDRYFRDPRLRSLFARYATYCGASPLQAPATLMLIAHVEQCGVWRIDGGMQRLAEAMVAELMRKGAAIRYASTVTEIDIRAGRAVGVRLATGEKLPAEAVIANADVAAIQEGLLGPAAAAVARGNARGNRRRRSLSAVTWSLVARTSGFELAHHNVFFPEDYPREFEEIFDHDALPSQPAVYVCAQDNLANSTHDERSRRLFMIANAPANGDRMRYDNAMTAPLQSAVFGLLGDCGLEVQASPARTVMTTPADFNTRFPGTGGALYGSPPHGWRSSFSRPAARTRIPGLYFAGGSVHPGPGVPMVALGGRFAALAAARDLGLAR